MSGDWKRWWRERGEDRLTLLLWAVWNPIGPVPLDEYEDYSGRVVTILERAHQADLKLLPMGDEGAAAVQLQRNALCATSAEELAALLATLRSGAMGLPPDASADRHAAETLLAWYEWEMMPG